MASWSVGRDNSIWKPGLRRKTPGFSETPLIVQFEHSSCHGSLDGTDVEIQCPPEAPVVKTRILSTIAGGKLGPAAKTVGRLMALDLAALYIVSSNISTRKYISHSDD